MLEVYLGTYDKWPKSLSCYSSAKARGSRGGKRHSYHYFGRADRSIRTEKATRLTKILPKGPIYRWKKFVCLSCGRESLQLVQKGIKIIDCEYCVNNDG